MFSYKHYITPGNLWQKLVIQSSFVGLADFSSPRLKAGAPKPGNWVGMIPENEAFLIPMRIFFCEFNIKLAICV
jgi:hypothetical protein